MFQTFDDISEGHLSKERLALLRGELAAQGLNGFIVPHSDAYQNEYLPAHAERLAWLTGFTGSAGIAIVLTDRAVIFVDGRYTLQVREQSDPALFEFMNVADKAPSAWLRETLQPDMKLGCDPWLHSVQSFRQIEKACDAAGAHLEPCENLIDAIWTDQPPEPAEPVRIHPPAYTGRTGAQKRAEIADGLRKDGRDAVVLTDLTSIAWLLNIRGRDVAHTPIVLCRAILYADGTVDLFVDGDKVTDEVCVHLGDDVHIHDPNGFEHALAGLGRDGKRVQIDPATAPSPVFAILKESGAEIEESADPCTLPKAIKNEAELDGARAAHLKDGIALCRFLAWMSAEAPKGSLTEIEAARKLEEFRTASNALQDLSFDTISGAGAHGAVVHYRVTEKTNKALEPGTLFLLDSGGQYFEGTTDVTRTIAIGTPTEEMRDRFTRVLKGHITVASTKFPHGTTGAQLDGFARRALWSAGLDFDHGTGHGVGSYLSVHEGPQGISKRANTPFEPGMIVSNEPGYYKTDAFGIRIENLVVVTPAQEIEGGERPMLSFETITLAPIDRALINIALLSADELKWLNAYHRMVFDKVSPHLNEADRVWLEAATAPLT